MSSFEHETNSSGSEGNDHVDDDDDDASPSLSPEALRALMEVDSIQKMQFTSCIYDIPFLFYFSSLWQKDVQ